MPLEDKAQIQTPFESKEQTQKELKEQSQDVLEYAEQNQDALASKSRSAANLDLKSEVLQRQNIPTEIKLREFDEREKIALLLSSHCSLPSREDMLITSPEAESHLQSIIEDDTALVSVRMRALDALAYFPSPQNAETLRAVLANPKEAEARRILVSGMRAYLRLVGAQAAPLLETFLDNPDSFVRLVAIRSLSQCPGSQALSILQKHHSLEESRFFKTKMAQAIENHCKGDKVCLDEER